MTRARINQLLAFVVCLAFIVRAVEALRRPLETDEYTSLFVSSLSWNDMLHYLRFYDAHPPLFFALLSIIHASTVPVWIPRLLMVAFGTISIGLLFGIVTLWASAAAGLIAALFASFMPSLIYYDTWIRMYAPFYTLELLALWLLSLLLVRDNYSQLQRRAVWFAWAVANLATVYILYLGWFCFAAQILYIIIMRREAFFKALLGAVCVALAWLPQVSSFLYQNGRGGHNLRFFAGHEVSTLLLLPGQATVVPELEGWSAAVGAIVAWLWIALTLWLTIKSDTRRSLLAWLTAQPLLLIAFCLVTNKVIYFDRYYLLLAYGVSAWTGYAVEYLIAHNRRAVFTIGSVWSGVMVALGLAFAISPQFYSADWPGVTLQLRDHAQPGDLFVLESGQAEWAVFKEPNLAQHPKFMVWTPDNVPEAIAVINKSARVWLIAYQARGADPNLELLSEIQRAYRLKEFHLYERALPAEDVSVGLFVR